MLFEGFCGQFLFRLELFGSGAALVKSALFGLD